jgi:hypothetical protein
MDIVILDDGPGRELTPSEPESDDDTSSCQWQATEDEDYYFYFVTFEVEDCLFRVPSYQFFEQSPEFCEIYKLEAHLWADDGDPIKLEMVTQEGFRSLLKVLYPLSLFPSMKLGSLSKEEWTSVLTLASKWRFLRVRAAAKSVLEHLQVPLTSLEKICLGRDLSIPSWVIDGFVGLVQAKTITDIEALEIDSGAETTAYKLFRIRELRIAGELSSAKTMVEEIFKEELDHLRSLEETFSAFSL